MTTKELAREIARRTGLRVLDAERMLRCYAEIINECLRKGGKVSITGLGSFMMSGEKEPKRRTSGTRRTSRKRRQLVFKARK